MQTNQRDAYRRAKSIPSHANESSDRSRRCKVENLCPPNLSSILEVPPPSRPLSTSMGPTPATSLGPLSTISPTPILMSSSTPLSDPSDFWSALVELRRDIHQHPEPGFEETRTNAAIRRILVERAGLKGSDFKSGALTGLWVDIRVGSIGCPGYLGVWVDIQVRVLGWTSTGCSHRVLGWTSR